MRNHMLLALAVMAWLSLRLAAADQPVTPASLVPCPYTPEEIEEALGMKVNAGEAADMTFPAGRDVGCLYEVVGGATLAVRQTWDPTGNSDAAQTAAAQGARVEVIPGDPDGARWTTGGGDKGEPRVELGYARGKVRTKVLVQGGTFHEPEMQPKLLALKRVP